MTSSDLPSQCCTATTKTISKSERLVVIRCTACGTLWGEHAASPNGRPWDDAYIPDDFAAALRSRRVIQARKVLNVLQRAGAAQPVLDYGAGQGVFLSTALAAGLDAYGCDLDLNVPLGIAATDRLLQLTEPWQQPNQHWGTVVMLDVLEHNPDPIGFMASLDSEYLLLKLPNATGPSARLARLAARFGRPSLLEQLFLVGENAPHQWLATQRGIKRLAEQGRWRQASRSSIVEVGTELPVRMRSASSRWPVRWVLTIVGAGLGLVGRRWSDSDVTVFVRA